MKSILSLTVAFTLATSGPVAALSCLVPNVTDSYRWASEAEEVFVALYGTFAFAPPPSSDTGDINFPREVSYVASFEGQALTANGFRTVAPKEVTVTHSCSGPWCGTLAPDVATMAFVEKRDDALFLSVGPCGGQTFPEPTRHMIDQVETCLQDGACTG